MARIAYQEAEDTGSQCDHCDRFPRIIMYVGISYTTYIFGSISNLFLYILEFL
ncbi:hypothetical protein Cflav_PD3910 [Pedosphaera parvula Ellin514]|uniref:Uncharacterized protein n=1 Tax=Pedosphaera parvula (strain Ellin514) TaxID=320771 RepID=B9XG31_PEDPL|nr:hypothetical protein Cflav_PD3910 [Pedosphaera parvula Ellin514]